jgi:ABC-type phosphate transport system substrate-binding protein
MNIKRAVKLLSYAALTCSVSFSAFAETVVIVHPDNDAVLDTKSIQRIFSGKEKRFFDGRKVLPINQVTDSNSRNEFDTVVMQRNTAQIEAYWAKQIFTGKGIPPREVADDLAVIEIVGANIDAIGYVDKASVSDNVKVVSFN